MASSVYNEFIDINKVCSQSIIEKMLNIHKNQTKIPFALGLPSSKFFPILDIQKSVATLTADDFQYNAPSLNLKSHIVNLMQKRGVKCNTEQIFLTTGGQEGISLLIKMFLKHNDQIIAEKLSYTGFIQAINEIELDITIVNTLDSGIDVNEIHKHLQQGKRPKLIYVITDGHNPLSVSMSHATRLKLISIADQYQIPIIEDDPYGFLFYENQMPTLKSLNPDGVFYIGTFSKILMPALKVGWIILPERYNDTLKNIKNSWDLNTATFSQRVIANFLETNSFSNHLLILRNEYKKLRDIMICALKDYFPKNAKYIIPNSGMFIWVELNNQINTNKLLEISLQEYGITFMPSSVFGVTKDIKLINGMRLNFTNCNPEEIIYGIEILGKLISRF